MNTPPHYLALIKSTDVFKTTVMLVLWSMTESSAKAY